MSGVISDRARGSMLGLAVGDALGAIVEFKAPGSFEPVTGMRKSESWDIPVGAYTDDTSQALCLARSLIEVGFDVEDQLRRYVDWWQNGYMSSTGECFDIGVGTREALSRWIEQGSAGDGVASASAAGAGSIMRLAPLAIWAAEDPRLGELARASARTTHGAPEAVDGARYFAELLRAALVAPAGADAGELRARALNPELDLGGCHPQIAALAGADLAARNAEDFHDNGYVVTCLESALWALATTETFEDGMLAAVSLGRDSDTRAAVYGQLAGAIYGAGAIPGEWVEGLMDAGVIEGVVGELLGAQNGSGVIESRRMQGGDG